MKKLFTLIGVALMAMSANAQDKYEAVKIITADDGSETYQIADEFKAVVDEDGKTVKAANVKDNMCTVVIETANVKCEAVASGTVARNGDGDDISVDGVVASWNNIEFSANKNRVVKDADNKIIGRSLNIGSTGIAYTKILAVQASKDGEVIPDTYKADYEYYESHVVRAMFLLLHVGLVKDCHVYRTKYAVQNLREAIQEIQCRIENLKQEDKKEES
jgi:hypothetical protein